MEAPTICSTCGEEIYFEDTIVDDSHYRCYWKQKDDEIIASVTNAKLERLRELEKL